MAKLNPWETDSTAADFVQAVTALDDAARIMFQIVDPNNSERGQWRKITGENLKKALAFAPITVIKENIGTTYADIATHTFTADDIVFILFYETQTGSERGSFTMGFVFEDLRTSQPTTSNDEWSGQGARLQLIKSGQKIQARVQGPVNSSNKLIAIVISTDPS